MKKIIRHGYGQYVATCDRCACKFVYELQDINGLGFVSCPECYQEILHDSDRKVSKSRLGEVRDEEN